MTHCLMFFFAGKTLEQVIIYRGVLGRDGKAILIGIPLSAMRRQPNPVRAEPDRRWLYNKLERHLEISS